MRLFRLLLIDAKIILARSIQPLVTQDFLDVDDGTTVEDEVSSHRMAEDVRSKLLINVRKFPVPAKEPPDIVSIKPGVRFFSNKNSFVGILTPF